MRTSWMFVMFFSFFALGLGGCHRDDPSVSGSGPLAILYASNLEGEYAPCG